MALKLWLALIFLSVLSVQQAASVCKTTSGLTCLDKNDPEVNLFFKYFGWESTCFKYGQGRWCMFAPGQLKPCKCTKGCCGKNTDGSKEDGGDEDTGESGGDGNQGNGMCDSSTVKDYKGCKALKKTFCPLTTKKKGKTYQNTLCLYCGENKKKCKGRICDYDILSQKDKDLIVKIHNKYRSTVALGKEKRGVGGPQPSAANMRRLKWDDNLAKGAQMWALQCPDDHDKNRLTPEFNGPNVWVGQNIASAWSSAKSFRRDYEDMIQGWYDEVKDFPPKNVKSYSNRGATGVIGHYTAMVWAKSTRIGCGYIMYYDTTQPRYPYKKMLICNYAVGGNLLGREVYKIGKPGSACPKGHKNGLCK